MKIKQFIEKAIEGGWKKELKPKVHESGWVDVLADNANSGTGMISKEQTLLDPKAWEAVGKIEGWELVNENGTGYDEFVSIYAHVKTGHKQWNKEGKTEEWHWNMKKEEDGRCPSRRKVDRRIYRDVMSKTKLKDKTPLDLILPSGKNYFQFLKGPTATEVIEKERKQNGTESA